MKKKIRLLILVIIGGTCMLLSVFSLHKDMEINDVIWTTYVCDKDGKINGGIIYLYSDGKRNSISDIALSNVSKKGENLLVGVQNLYLNATGFNGIITYDISSKEVTEILGCDKVYSFLGDGNHEFRGNIQMTKDSRFFYFVCGGQMILYDSEKDKMEILFEASCYQYILNEDETYLYFSKSETLFRYNLSTKEKEFVTDKVYNFSISKDEMIICYENRDDQALFLYHMDSGENEKIVDLNYRYSEVCISKDNHYLLYTDYKESIVPTNRRIYIWVLDLETGNRKNIYRGNYGDNIRSVLW